MWEILTRSSPFSDLKTPWAVRTAVLSGIRPPVPTSQPRAVTALMERCWAADPMARPSFKECVEKLKQVPTSEAALASSNV